MILLDDFAELKRRHEEAQKARDRAAGALAELEKRLKKEFNVTSLAEAKLLLNRLQKTQQRLLGNYLREKKKFKEKFSGGDKGTREAGEATEGRVEARQADRHGGKAGNKKRS